MPDTFTQPDSLLKQCTFMNTSYKLPKAAPPPQNKWNLYIEHFMGN